MEVRKEDVGVKNKDAVPRTFETGDSKTPRRSFGRVCLPGLT